MTASGGLERVGRDRPAALVTGGARRVGAATCRALARAGLDVVLTFRSSRDDARALVAELTAGGVSAAAVRADFAEPGAADELVERVTASVPRLDVLVLSAAVYEPSPIDAWDEPAALRQHRINALAPATLAVGLARTLAGSDLPGGGAVVALCDIHAMGRPRPGYLAYSMSKAALAELVPSLARELAPGVRVNGVAPGAVAFAESGPDSDPEMRARYLRRVPLGRVGAPEDAAEAVRWLALDARYTTGQIVRVDGGRWVT